MLSGFNNDDLINAVSKNKIPKMKNIFDRLIDSVLKKYKPSKLKINEKKIPNFLFEGKVSFELFIFINFILMLC